MGWRSVEKLVKTIRNESWAAGCPGGSIVGPHLAATLQNAFLPGFLSEISDKVEAIIEIDPELPEPEILVRVTRYMVEFLGALSSSVRIFDPDTGQMLSYGSYPFQEASRATYIPLENTIAGEVLKTQKTFLVPNIRQESLYTDKAVIDRRGAHSLMAIPFAIPRFFPHERETAGVIQIYYPELDRVFLPLNIQMAELWPEGSALSWPVKRFFPYTGSMKRRKPLSKRFSRSLVRGRGSRSRKKCSTGSSRRSRTSSTFQSCRCFFRFPGSGKCSPSRPVIRLPPVITASARPSR